MQPRTGFHVASVHSIVDESLKASSSARDSVTRSAVRMTSLVGPPSLATVRGRRARRPRARLQSSGARFYRARSSNATDSSKMKLLRLLPLLLLCSCSTIVKYENGQEVLRTNTDFDSLDIDSKTPRQSISVHIRGHHPSTTIRAGGSVAGTAGSSITAMFLAWLSHGAVH